MRAASAVVSLVLAAACAGEKAIAPAVRPPDGTLGSVIVADRNVILAVGGSHQVGVIAGTLSGAPITAFDSVRYVLPTITDTLRVRVGADGLVTALASSGATPVRLNVFAYKDGVGKGDQAILQVTPTALANPTLSIQRVAPDSTRLDFGRSRLVVPTIRDAATGATVASPTFRYAVRANDAQQIASYGPTLTLPGPGGVQVSSGLSSTLNIVRALRGEGTPWLIAESKVYGVTLKDSIQLTLQYPFSQTVSVTTFAGLSLTVLGGAREVLLKQGGSVSFATGIALLDLGTRVCCVRLPISYEFDGPGAPGPATPPSTAGGASGNIVSISGTNQSVRVFSVPGLYRWTATVEGNYPPYTGMTISGSITVK